MLTSTAVCEAGAPRAEETTHRGRELEVPVPACPSVPGAFCKVTSLLCALSFSGQGSGGRGENRPASSLSTLTGSGLKQRAFCMGPGTESPGFPDSKDLGPVCAASPWKPGAKAAWTLGLAASQHSLFPEASMGGPAGPVVPETGNRASQRRLRGSGSRSQKLGAGDQPAWPAWEGGGF